MIKILGIGNSFTEDAFVWLGDICAADGIEVKTVCPFIGGCTFKRHCDRIESTSPDYELIVNGKFTGKKVSLVEALQMEEWDIVTFNQGSVQAGRPFSYVPYLNKLKDLILKYSPKAKLYMFQTWSYEIDSTLSYFKIYNSDQREMWLRTRDSYKLASRLINAPIIPVGDVIQYIRENIPEFDYKNGGMSLNRDGHHLSEIYGRYAAGLTFYYSIFGGDVFKNTFAPSINNVETNNELIDKIKNVVLEIVNRPSDVDDD